MQTVPVPVTVASSERTNRHILLEANRLRAALTRALGKSLKTVQAAVEHVGITTIGIGIRVLPNSVNRPAAGQGADSARPSGQHERVRGRERLGVAGALVPPRVVGVDHGVAARLGVVAVGEGLDPADHGRGRQAEAGGLARDRLQVDHARKSDAVVGPAAAVGEEVIGLGGAGGRVRVRKVVAAADEAGGGGAGVVGGELGVGVCGSFGGL